MRGLQEKIARESLKAFQPWLIGTASLALLFFDRWLKWYANSRPGGGTADFFYFSYAVNPVAVFSLPISVVILVPLGLMALATLFYLGWRAWQQQHNFKLWGASLMLIGGLSNLFDRLWLAGVGDIFHVGGLSFNLADLYLLLGLGLMLFKTNKRQLAGG